ncbi:MAG TPA: hypothetical protein VKY90_12545 [Candidatus Dormibacteraeota bacterium]|nr:hypothetical protein [Candidatus Dormibacteraeota bacterium]
MKAYPLELVPGQVHAAWDASGRRLATVWPTHRPDRWHVSVAGDEVVATMEPLTEDQVRALLDRWGFLAAVPWRRWPARPQGANPFVALGRGG